MNIELTINGVDFSRKLSAYRVTQEVTYDKVLNTIDGKELSVGKRVRDVVSFSLFPLTENESEIYYSALTDGTIVAKYTKNGTTTEEMRLASNLESAFLLNSVDGQRRYKGGEIVLRAINAN